MQNFFLVGNLGKDPELRHTNSGDAVVNFSMADTERYTDKSGEKVEKTEWFNCVAFRRQAEVIAEYVKKGQQLAVTGSIKTRTYEKDGETKYFTEVHVRSFEFIGGKSPDYQKPAGEKKKEGAQKDDFGDSIPF